MLDFYSLHIAVDYSNILLSPVNYMFNVICKNTRIIHWIILKFKNSDLHKPLCEYLRKQANFLVVIIEPVN